MSNLLKLLINNVMAPSLIHALQYSVLGCNIKPYKYMPNCNPQSFASLDKSGS